MNLARRFETDLYARPIAIGWPSWATTPDRVAGQGEPTSKARELFCRTLEERRCATGVGPPLAAGEQFQPPRFVKDVIVL